ncbi:endolytic transglycosylase MltG [Nesterenkonia massiliensis]|uniref:Endolytic murein transglycosylase n=1 Tax=Nesterenkonia massiliensis TaxID=1232429 RepID=A0ABT2HN88_9MICC|nr:endolytic transglycosylase MltG [Nesterenkonia massiliensis]
MSDEQTPEAGSRRRRREIREARERERAAARERESAVRRLSSASTAADSPPLFDQEAQRKAAHLDNAAQDRSPGPAASGSRQTRGQEPDPRRTSRNGPAQNSPAQGNAAQSSAAQGTAAKTPGMPADSRRAAATPPGQQDTPKASAKSKPSLLFRGTQHQTSQQKSAASKGAVPTPAPIPSDSPAPRASNSPSTPFEQVVAGSPISPEPSDTEFGHDEGAEYYSEHHEQDAFDPFGDYSEWDEDYEGEIERDEDGHSVLVGASGFGRGYQTVTPMDGRVSLRVLKQRRAKRRRRNITLTFALAGFAVMVIGVVVIINSLLGRGGPQDYEAVSGDAITFVIHPGEGFESVRNRLVDEEIIASADAFNTALSEMESEPAVHEGRYPLHEQMPAAEAVDILFGEGEPAYTIYIEPNWWIDETFAEIAEKTPHSVQDLEAAAADPTAYGLPERAESLEGYLPPGEHEFPIEDEMTAEEILQELTGITLRRLEDLGITDPEEQFETVIVASLITAEANHNDPDSYPVMAGAIYNRLEPDNPETDGYLYIDATNNYGLGEHDIHGATQLDEDSPWNSRTQPGLPPGPVGAPLRATLEAAAQPQENDYNYWVTVDLETGQTEFSETYEQHRVYEQQFLDWCDDHPGVCSPADVESTEEEFSE